jgi:hypothetical protein
MRLLLFVSILFISHQSCAKRILLSFEEMVNRSDMIIVGKVISVKGNIIKVQVSETIKGKVKEKLTVINGPSSSYSRIGEGETILIFMHKRRGRYRFSNASASQIKIKDGKGLNMFYYDEPKNLEEFKLRIDKCMEQKNSHLN